MRFTLIICVWALSSLVSRSEDSLEVLRAQFHTAKSFGPNTAKAMILEVGRSGDQNAVPFLMELYNSEPRNKMGLWIEHPHIKASYTYAGIAQIALAELGVEEKVQELLNQASHEDIVVRDDALKKLILFRSDIAIEAISSFIGDGSSFGDVIDLPDWIAVIELTKRIKNPPYPVRDYSGLSDYNDDGGREMWLEWRYDNFGPVPRLKELYIQFAEGNTSQAAGSYEIGDELNAGAKAIDQTLEAETIERMPEGAIVGEELGPDFKELLLYILGAVVVIVVLFFVLKRRSV